ncbi:MAG: AAA family ATPase [Planctomycetes bacterium]|nr:AAA family ATPase [Planctomycetota bacterium]
MIGPRRQGVTALELKDYLEIVRRRWWWIAVLVILFLVGHATLVYRQPSRYQAQAKIVVNPKRYEAWELTDLRPDTYFFGSEAEAGETVWDEAVLEYAALLLEGQRDFASEVFAGSREKMADVQSYRREFEGAVHRDVVRAIQASVNTRGRGTSEIHDVFAVSTSPLRARAIADAVAEAAAQFHKEQSTHILKQQMTAQDEAWETAVARLREHGERLNAFAAENGVHSIEAKTQLVLEALAGMKARDEELRSAIKKNSETMQFEVAEQVEALNRFRDVDTAAQESPQIGVLKSRLVEGEMELDAMLNGHPARTEEHPQVVEQRNRLAGLRHELERETQRVVDQRAAEFSRRLKSLARDNVLLQVDRDIIVGRREEKKKELARLSEVRTRSLELEDAFKESQAQVAELSRNRNALRRSLEVVEGPIVVFGTTRADKVQEVPRAGGSGQALFLTGVMAVLLAVGGMYFVEMLDTRVASEYDVRRHLNLPLLGVVTDQGKGDVLLPRLAPKSPVAEEFLTVATLLEVSMQEQALKSVMVCSTNPKEGKTTVSVNLAVALARKGFDTVLVDADMRRPQIHSSLGLRNEAGLGELLQAYAERPTGELVESMLVEGGGQDAASPDLESYLRETSVANLRVITSGAGGGDPVGLLSSGHVKSVLEDLKELVDCVVFDTPPLTQVSDALSLATVVDGCIFVVGSRLCEQHEVSWTKHLLNNVNAKIVGVILNMAAKKRRQEYYYYYSEEVKSLRQSN